MKVVIHNDIGGFLISQKAFERMIELGAAVTKEEDENTEAFILDRGEDNEFLPRYDFVKWHNHPTVRTNSLLIQVIEEFGDEAHESQSKLKIVEVPDGVKFGIGENEMGYEWVYELHRTWR